MTVIELQPLTKGDTVVTTPIIIGSSPSHITVAFAISRVELARHRRFLEMLLAATPPIPGNYET